MDRERNILFALLAVQLNKAAPADLIDVALSADGEDPRSTGELLVEAGVLGRQDCELIAGFVEQAIRAHDNDAGATVASFGGEAFLRRTCGDRITFTPDGSLTRDPESLAQAPREAVDRDIAATAREIPGRYRGLGELTRGGVGRVLIAYDEHLDREVALKELLPGEGGGMSAKPFSQAMPRVARFLREARITGQLEHPAIVPVHELGRREDGTPYYTMKLVRGRSLQEALNEAKDLAERLGLLPHLVDMCQAVAYAHSRGVLHRDLKPGNVMVGEFGETVIIDWGLAKSKARRDQAEEGESTAPAVTSRRHVHTAHFVHHLRGHGYRPGPLCRMA
jgi:eukaryotic-like serine/threonine-protein kinase